MKFTLDNPQGEFVFSNYGDGFLTVNDQSHSNSLVIFPDLLETWEVTGFDQLTADHFDIFIDRKPDVVILGTGASQQFPPVELRRELVRRKIQLDIMDTPAACRTYNLLVSEDRDVGAAILIM